MTLTAWLALLAISLLGAVSPGPSLAVVAKSTLGGNKLNGILTAWAHALGIGVYACLTLFGLMLVLKENPALFQLITYAGALYLAWLGISALRSRGGIAAKLDTGKATGYGESMRNGLMISLLNPKIGLFFLALFSQFIHPEVGLWGKIITMLTPMCVDGLWYTLVALMLSHPRILPALRSKARWIDRLTGVVLLLLALRIIWGA
ncbi:MAG: lysine transporter LysE [Gammaproteobacteria bacterium]|nr:MAG: lysine transporter LysE [Gammaproteobacteria bacterium]